MPSQHSVLTGLSSLALLGSLSAFGSDIDTRGPQVQNWVRDLPTVSSLHGSPGCESISFPHDRQSGLVGLLIGTELNQGWLGIDGDVQITPTTLTQDYHGGGVDTDSFHFQIELVKSGGRLVSAHYRYSKVSGFIFTHETLMKEYNCRS